MAVSIELRLFNIILYMYLNIVSCIILCAIAMNIYSHMHTIIHSCIFTEPLRFVCMDIIVSSKNLIHNMVKECCNYVL